MTMSIITFILFFLRFYLLIFKEKGREGEREEEKYHYVVASHISSLVSRPTTQACTLTGN